MAWKPKEKPLTLEEAIELAKKELKPFWFGSEPLLAAIQEGGVSSLRPLDKEFAKKNWLIYLVDPTDYASEFIFSLSREWHRRYGTLNLGMLIIFRANYSFMRTPKSVSQFLKKQQISFPVVLDADGLLSQALKADVLPKLLLLSKGQIQFERSGKDWHNSVEAQIQSFLRITDPGLPLLPLMESPKNVAQDLSRMELGSGHGTEFPKPGFAPAPNGFLIGSFGGERPATTRKGSIFLSGQWIQDGERIATSDPKAVLSFNSVSARVGIVAQSLSKSGEPAKIYVDLNDAPVSDAFAADALQADDDGQSFVRVEAAGLYPMLSGLVDRKREVTLHLMNADRVPVALYGIRFAQ